MPRDAQEILAEHDRDAAERGGPDAGPAATSRTETPRGVPSPRAGRRRSRRLRQRRRQLGERERAAQRDEPAGDPDAHHQPPGSAPAARCRPGDRKMPEPIVMPTTSAMPLHRPSVRGRRDGGWGGNIAEREPNTARFLKGRRPGGSHEWSDERGAGRTLGLGARRCGTGRVWNQAGQGAIDRRGDGGGRGGSADLSGRDRPLRDVRRGRNQHREL